MKNKKVPDGWNPIKLGKLLTEVSERNKNNKNTPVLSVTNKTGFVISEDYFSKKVFSKDLSNYKVIRKGQFAYNPSRVNVGSIACLKEFDKGLLSPMYVVFEAKEGLDIKYLDYWISSPHFRNFVKAGTQGTVRDSLNYSSLAGFPFLLPPVSEQHKIYGILSSIDAVINKTQAIIDQTQIFKKGLMQELFTRGIPGRHKKFKKTEIWQIPEEWEVKAVKELIDSCQYGLNKPLFSEPIGIPILRMNNLGGGEINIENVKYAVLTKEEEQAYILKDGDLLFNRTNSQALVGKVAIYKGNKKIAFASYLIRLKVNPDKADSRWLNYYFNTDEIQDKLRHLATPGVSQSNINAKIMQTLKLRTPPLREQEEISDLIDIIKWRLNKENEIIKMLNDAKSALMQVLLTGKVRAKKQEVYL